MAITLGAFTKQNDGSFTGVLRTLNITANLNIIPAVAKSSGETYLNLKIAAPEFGQNLLRTRLVKLENPQEDGTTHLALWEPRAN